MPIDVLAELVDHGPDRPAATTGSGKICRREAVDKATALSFMDGNWIWRDALLVESVHACYTVGEAAVPDGRCTEPSNVQVGGAVLLGPLPPRRLRVTSTDAALILPT